MFEFGLSGRGCGNSQQYGSTTSHEHGRSRLNFSRNGVSGHESGRNALPSPYRDEAHVAVAPRASSPSRNLEFDRHQPNLKQNAPKVAPTRPKLTELGSDLSVSHRVLPNFG